MITERSVHSQVAIGWSSWERNNLVPPLSLEVARIIKENKAFLYKLPGTGFNVKKQADLFTSNIQEGKEISESLAQIEEDIKGFRIEYLLEKGLFPIILARQSVAGKERIVAPLYGGKIWTETISEQERDGEIKKAITGNSSNGEKMGIEQFLLSAPPGSLAVLVSPPGWSGYPGISYKDTQTYIFQVQEDGRPRGFTVKADIDVVQAGELLKRLGADKETLESADMSDKAEVKRVVRSYVLLNKNNQEKSLEIEDIINLIREIKGSDIAFLDTKGSRRYFSQIISDLRDPESLWTLDEKAKSLINEFKNFALYLLVNGDLDTGENLEIALGVTILKLAKTIRGKSKSVWGEARENINYHGGQLGNNPMVVLTELQKIPGCAGGGQNESAIIESITPRSGIVENDKYGSRIFECPECHKKVTRPKDQLLSKCPHCESSKVAC